MEPMPDVIRHFHPVLPSRRLGKAPVAVELAGRRYALFRGAGGRPAALLDRCPHRFAPLSKGRVRPDGRLACPYHGWHFDAEGYGESPTRATLARCETPSFQVIEHAGYLWMASRQTPLSAMPRTEWEGFELAGSLSTLFQAPLHVALDNFSEDEHTPFVHHRLGWDEAGCGSVEFEAHNFDDRTEVRYRAPQRWSFIANFMPIRRSDDFNNSWITRFDPVRLEYDLHWTERVTGKVRPLRIKVLIFILPETPGTSRFHTFVYLGGLDRRHRPLRPLLRRAVTRMVRQEVEADARFIPLVADTPFEMKGMKLGRFDKPLIHQRKLLGSIYWGASAADPARGAASASNLTPAPR